MSREIVRRFPDPTWMVVNTPAHKIKPRRKPLAPGADSTIGGERIGSRESLPTFRYTGIAKKHDDRPYHSTLDCAHEPAQPESVKAGRIIDWINKLRAARS